MKKYAVIVAGGSGSRMGASIPKQFLLLNGEPILFRTIRAFACYKEHIEIILVLPKDEFKHFEDLSNQYQFKHPVTLIAGGNSRYESVGNGLASIPNKDVLVAIHDGVRPFVSHNLIEESFEKASVYGNAIAAVLTKDSIRKKEGGGTVSVNRKDYYLVQTPQTFQLEKIQKGYGTVNKETFTDDASVAESLGEKIQLISGDYKNIKITTPEDLLVAESFVKEWTY